MGVTYKLKQEVVDFIVALKQTEPTLSCRKMGARIKEHFGVEVSKSSVNAVMKDASLSSPVGRPARAPSSKFFTIPQDKKEDLLKNVATFLAPVLTPPPLSATLPRAVVEPLPQIPEKLPKREPFFEPDPGCATVEEKPEPAAAPPSLDLSAADRPEIYEFGRTPSVSPVDKNDTTVEDLNEPVLLAAPDERLSLPADLLHKDEPAFQESVPGKERSSFDDTLRPAWFGDRGAVVENLGLFLMAASLWGASRSSRIGALLSARAGLGAETARSLESELVAHYFGPGPDLPGFFSPVGSLDLSALGQDLSWGRALAYEAQILQTTGAVVRVRSDQGDAFYFDPLYLSCETDPAKVMECECPLFAMIEEAAERLVTGTAPFIIGRIPGVGLDDKTRALLSVLDGKGQLERIEILSKEKNELMVFPQYFSGPRKVIAAVTLSQAEVFLLEMKVLDNSQEFFDPFLEQSFMFLEGFLPQYPQLANYRVLIVRKKNDKTGERSYILTNMKERADSMIKNYFRLFVNRKSHSYSTIKSVIDRKVGNNYNKCHNDRIIAPLIKSSADIDIVLRQLLLNLTGSLTGIQDPDTLSTILRLSGYYKQAPHDVLVRLIVPRDSALTAYLEGAFSLIHARGLCDPLGKRLHFSLESM